MRRHAVQPWWCLLLGVVAAADGVANTSDSVELSAQDQVGTRAQLLQATKLPARHGRLQHELHLERLQPEGARRGVEAADVAGGVEHLMWTTDYRRRDPPGPGLSNERLCLTSGGNRDYLAGVDEHGRIAVPALEGEVVDAEHTRDARW